MFMLILIKQYLNVKNNDFGPLPMNRYWKRSKTEIKCSVALLSIEASW